MEEDYGALSPKLGEKNSPKGGTEPALNLPEHAMVTDCPAQWGSTERMMERVLEQQRFVKAPLCGPQSVASTWKV